MKLGIYKTIMLTLTMSVITSCSTMNKNECLTADWKTVGYGDGTRGYSASRISQHRSACAEHGIKPDLNAYTKGREQGLLQYCTPAKGYNRGRSGYGYNGICAGKNEQAFIGALNYGLTIYKAEKVLSKLKNDYADEERYIRKLERRLHNKEDKIVSGKLTKVKALKLLNETKEMAEELGKAKTHLNSLDYEIVNQENHIADLKNRGRYN